MSEFRHRLHPAQVLDLAERTPESALKWCVKVAPQMCKILAAGGDGTVAWINNTIHKMQLDVSIILSHTIRAEIIFLRVGNVVTETYMVHTYV